MTVVAVDLGRSGARVVRRAPRAADVRRTTGTGDGLGDPGGAATVAAALRAAVGDPPERPWALVVGVPGVLTHRRAGIAAADLAATLVALTARDGRRRVKGPRTGRGRRLRGRHGRPDAACGPRRRARGRPPGALRALSAPGFPSRGDGGGAP